MRIIHFNEDSTITLHDERIGGIVTHSLNVPCTFWQARFGRCAANSKSSGHRRGLQGEENPGAHLQRSLTANVQLYSIHARPARMRFRFVSPPGHPSSEAGTVKGALRSLWISPQDGLLRRKYEVFTRWITPARAHQPSCFSTFVSSPPSGKWTSTVGLNSRRAPPYLRFPRPGFGSESYHLIRRISCRALRRTDTKA
jgi:hypothetical protein